MNGLSVRLLYLDTVTIISVALARKPFSQTGIYACEDFGRSVPSARKCTYGISANVATTTEALSSSKQHSLCSLYCVSTAQRLVPSGLSPEALTASVIGE